MLTKKQYLDAMGIDVWERRALKVDDPLSIPGEPEVAPVQDEPLKIADATPDPAAGSAQLDEPRFRMALYHYQSVGLCLLLDEQAALPRRLCDDIARVSGGDLKALRFQELKWPMLETGGIDQSIDAAREVVTQKLLSLPARLIIFGADIRQYFQPLADVAPMQPTTIGRQGVLLIPDLSKFIRSAEEKRTLLKIVSGWQATP